MLTLGRNTLLRLNSVSVHYGDLQALRDVSIAIHAGEIISIIGSNGAGKTTMMNTISGVLRCSSGAIQFMAGNIENLPTHEIVAKGIIQVPEGRLLFQMRSRLASPSRTSAISSAVKAPSFRSSFTVETV